MSVNDPSFDELPLSYRLSQRSMLAAVATLFLFRRLASMPLPLAAKWSLASLIGSVVVFALCAASYVVIRYPYLSLIQTRDGDVYSSQFTSKTLAMIIKVVGLLTVFVALLLLLVFFAIEGFAKTAPIVAFSYVLPLFLFVCFLCFRYDPIEHPTVATFIRSTLGIGIVLVPLFIPILIVGSLRCRTLLDNETARQQAEAPQGILR